MSEWLQPHSVVEILSFLVIVVTAAMRGEARLTKLETKIDLLMQGFTLSAIQKGREK